MKKIHEARKTYQVIVWLVLVGSIILMGCVLSMIVFAGKPASIKRINITLPSPFRDPDASSSSSAILELHYLSAKKIAAWLNQKGLSLLSSHGFASALPSRNTLYIADGPAQLQAVRRVMQRLDHPRQQVMIRARIVDIDQQDLQKLGVTFFTKPQESTRLHMDMPSVQFGQLTFPLVRLANTTLLSMQLNALQEQGHARLLSVPEVLTMNRHSAVIESGEEIPYQENSGNGTTSVAFKKAVLRLKVTPIILPKQHMLLTIELNQDKVSSIMVKGVPTIRTRKITTQIRLRSGDTVILGGIFESAITQSHQAIPGLAQLPIIGMLFKQKRAERRKRELFMFITPVLMPEN